MVQQEKFCGAYIRAVAAVAGCALVGHDEADYGCDYTVCDVVELNGKLCEGGWPVQIQAKSTCNAIFDADCIRYDLEVKNYNDLIREERASPLILVLLIVPPDELDWLDQSEEHILLRRCAYWASLRGGEATANKTTVRIEVPRAQTFTPEALKLMIANLKQGVLP